MSEIKLADHQKIFIEAIIDLIESGDKRFEFLTFIRSGKTFALNELDKELNRRIDNKLKEQINERNSIS